MGYPGIGVMSTFAAPARNSPQGSVGRGAGSLPDIPAHPLKMKSKIIEMSTLELRVIILCSLFE
jgi:hypothetical protein